MPPSACWESVKCNDSSGATEISEEWTQQYINRKHAPVPKRTAAVFKKSHLIPERDEIWSFVGSKKSKAWIWIAIDRNSRKKLPESCWENAVFNSDFLPAYEKIFPHGRHFYVGKKSGKAIHVERLNLNLRRRAPRLGRKTPPFSENMKNHIGAIWSFIHHCNENIYPNLATMS